MNRKLLLTILCLLIMNAAPSTGMGAANYRANPEASRELVEVYSLSNEENNAYDAAFRELDSQKRAVKLYEFIQKYPKSPLIKRIPNADYERITIIENEYSAYYRARQEADLEKRAGMLLELYSNNQGSVSIKLVENDYLWILKDLYRDKDYKQLSSLGENWLAVNPNDSEVNALVGEASMRIGKYQTCGKYLEVVYKTNPSSNLAMEIQGCYQKANNREKMNEWTEKLFKMPEFDTDYMLRFEYTLIYYNDRDFSKAAEYATSALKSIARKTKPSEEEMNRLQKVSRACHHIIASNFVDKGNFTEAIAEFEKAIAFERYAEGYYGIGLCFDNTKQIEDAMLYYAAADLMDQKVAPQAKNRLEVLYKALHNGTLIGINKVYSKAQKMLEDHAVNKNREQANLH